VPKAHGPSKARTYRERPAAAVGALPVIIVITGYTYSLYSLYIKVRDSMGFRGKCMKIDRDKNPEPLALRGT